jgi:hypothetical protein
MQPFASDAGDGPVPPFKRPSKFGANITGSPARDRANSNPGLNISNATGGARPGTDAHIGE